MNSRSKNSPDLIFSIPSLFFLGFMTSIMFLSYPAQAAMAGREAAEEQSQKIQNNLKQEKETAEREQAQYAIDLAAWEKAWKESQADLVSKEKIVKENKRQGSSQKLIEAAEQELTTAKQNSAQLEQVKPHNPTSSDRPEKSE
jgi:hypothetical protein